LSAKAAEAKAKQDLLSMLHGIGSFRTGNRRSRPVLVMRTPARGSGFQNLCALDQLNVEYAPTALTDSGEDPVRPLGFGSRHLFHANSQPVTYFPESATPAERTWTSACTKLDSQKTTGWFEAPNEFEAARVVNFLQVLAKQVETGKTSVKSCAGLSNSTECNAAILKRVVPEAITNIEPCSASLGRACYDLQFESFLGLRIVATIDGGEITPDEIVEATDWDFITVT
jgi:hypothetical protein